jgi:NADH-quinone oxidoreductase subunit J
MHAIMFYIFATLSVICALAMVTRRDAVNSVFWLIACFLNVAGIFATLTAHFLAVLQVLVYAGAIMVFFLFVTMFLGDSSRIKITRGRLVPALAAATVLAFAVILAKLLGADPRQMGAVSASYGTVNAVSQKLLVDYLFLFEVAGLLLLVAVIGAVYIARKRPTPQLEDGSREGGES